jgi:protein-tyrosine kinase
MERIKQAIEKAKGLQPGWAQRESLDGKSSLPAGHAPDGLEGIKYEFTRVVQLNKDDLERHRVVAFNKHDPNGMVFDILRTNILHKMHENGWRTIGITSPTPESGKTVVSINLAMSIAQLTNKSAMLVDFDLRRPKVGTYLGLPMERSLNDLLDGTAEVRDVLVNPDMPRLVVLPTKTPVIKSSETLSSKRVEDMIREFRQRYDSRIVIFDLPPLLVIDDTIALLPQLDCVLLVVANGMNTKQQIQDSLRCLSSAKLIGTVLNKAEFGTKADYYY